MCGKCCETLEERAAPDWPASFDRLARIGFYGLPTKAGLQVWGWERARMADAARERGRAIGFVPSTVLFDDLSRKTLVLVWELDAMKCPLTIAGPGPAAYGSAEWNPGKLVCGAYAARPTVCRAYPVVVRADGSAYSSKCPWAFAPEGPGREGYAETYGGSFAAAEASTRLPKLVQQALGFLETVGEVRLARDLTREQTLTRFEAWPREDFTDLLSRSRSTSLHDFLGRIPHILVG